MCRFYGSRTEDVIRSIKALHITHMHGDHHMGVMDLVRRRQKYMPDNRPKLLLMAPKQPFESLLNFYEEHFGNVRDEFTMLNNEDLVRMQLCKTDCEIAEHRKMSKYLVIIFFCR